MTLQWHLKVKERNESMAKRLLVELDSILIGLDSILEIGCGIGTLLKVGQEQGYKVLGYDLEKESIDYGKTTFNIPLCSEMWQSDTVAETYKLLICISTLEHIYKPRELINEIGKYCMQHRSYAFISVPLLEKAKWGFLLNSDENIEGTPFFDNYAHVVHFSKKGLVKAFTDYGAKSYKDIIAGWSGVLFEYS